MRKTQGFIKGAVSIAGGISKILGGIYRIPLARLIGDEGMALYQMAYPIYTTILALATAGIPAAISVLVARKESQGYTGDSYKIFQISLCILFFFGVGLTLLVGENAYFLADTVLNEPRAYYPILAVAPAIFLSSLMSVFRGYFQGYQSMTPTAFSQVIEQIFRVVAVIILACLLLPLGLEYAVAGATFGAVIGGIIGLLVLGICYIVFSRNTKSLTLFYSKSSNFQLTKDIIRLAVPISLGACILPLVQILDAIIVRKQLEVIGYTHLQATMLFGQLSGKAAVLIGLPTIFTIAVATSMVPAISEAFTEKDGILLTKRLNYGFRAGAIISFPCATGLYVMAFPICALLYGNPEAGVSLEALAFSAITLAAFQISSAGLQGIGRPEIAMLSLLVTGFSKVVLNYTLTSIPTLNIKGAAIATTLAFLIGALINIFILKKITDSVFESKRIINIMLASVIMAILVKLLFNTLLTSDLHSYISTIIAIGAGAIIYGIALLALKEINLNLFKLLRKS